MACPHCSSSETSRRRRRTSLGYRTFACHACRRVFNERTGTPFNDLQHPTDIVLLTVLWRLRCKLSLRDVAEMLLQRGLKVARETVREWEFRFAPLLSERLRAKRRGRAGGWLLVRRRDVREGRRALVLPVPGDRPGRRPHRLDAQRTSRQGCRTEIRRKLVEVAERKPARVTTEQHPAYRRAIRWIIGRKALHRTTQYLNSYTEQSHRAVKQRYYPMLGFGNFESASRFCSAFDELRQYFRVRRRGDAHVSLAEQRRLFVTRWRSLIAEAAAA